MATELTFGNNFIGEIGMFHHNCFYFSLNINGNSQDLNDFPSRQFGN